MAVNASDFEIISATAVRHLKTGARFATYTYEDPRNAGSSVTVSPGTAGDGDHPTIDDLTPVAVQLLQGLALKAAKKTA